MQHLLPAWMIDDLRKEIRDHEHPMLIIDLNFLETPDKKWEILQEELQSIQNISSTL